ncbi:Uncharacterised protein [Pantoea agglomerans]|nr:Uncharacterised protein [Pantoea agglomerans]
MDRRTEACRPSSPESISVPSYVRMLGSLSRRKPELRCIANAQMGHSDAQMVYRVYGAWMSENNTDQLSLINTKMSDLVLHTCSTKVAV